MGRYHHLATAWLCWLSLAYNFAPGTWIAALNYSVHAPMYFYYFLSSVLSKKVRYKCKHPFTQLLFWGSFVSNVVFV